MLSFKRTGLPAGSVQCHAGWTREWRTERVGGFARIWITLCVWVMGSHSVWTCLVVAVQIDYKKRCLAIAKQNSQLRYRQKKNLIVVMTWYHQSNYSPPKKPVNPLTRAPCVHSPKKQTHPPITCLIPTPHYKKITLVKQEAEGQKKRDAIIIRMFH